MIFVTVGTYRFDALVEEVDRLAGAARLLAPAVVQLAHGTFLPKHCEWFRIAPTIKPYLQRASLVITHGGTTMHQALWLKKRVIAVPNVVLADNHQSNHVRKLAEEGSVLMCTDLHALETFIYNTEPLRAYESNASALIDDIRDSLGR